MIKLSKSSDQSLNRKVDDFDFRLPKDSVLKDTGASMSFSINHFFRIGGPLNLISFAVRAETSVDNSD